MNLRSIHFVILGILSDGPKHGYQIHKYINDPDGIGAVWKIKITNIYGLIDVLEKKGYVVPSKLQIDDSSYPPKKYFEITDGGIELFQTWLHEPVKHGREIRQVFLSKLYFANKEGKENALKLMFEQIKECHQWLKNSEELPEGDATEFTKAVYSFRLSQMKSYITWLEELAKK
ncbi:MAG: PadR family transcriptional regulator [Anaerolineaceae bacterium]